MRRDFSSRVVSSRTLFALSLLASTAFTTPVLAQAAAQPDSATQVKEVIVTAQKRTERLVNVPISITVNNAVDIKNKNVTDLTDLAQKMPNVNGGGSLFATFTIRGIASNSAGSGFPPDVGVNVDEVFMGRDRAFDTVLANVSSVEVLRGPQGTLYGKNTIAGVMNITTQRPTDQFQAYGDVRYGNLNYIQARGTVSGPVYGDNLLVGVTGIYQKRDGYLSDPVLHSKLGSLDDGGARIMVVAHPTTNLTVELRGDFYKENDTNGQEETQSTITGAVLPFPPFNTVPAQHATDRIVDVNTQPLADRTMSGVSAKVEYVANDYTFDSITAGRHLSSDEDFDNDGGPLDGFDTGQLEDVSRFSQEFRLTSPSMGRFSWIAGAYFDNETDHDLYHLHIGPGFPTALFGAPFPPVEGPTFSERAQTDAMIKSRSEAVFLSGKYSITDKLKLSGGLRYTSENKHLDFTQGATQLDPNVGFAHPVFAFIVTIPHTTDTYNGSAVTGDANLSYDFTRDEVGYVRYSRGYKAGGFQSDVISPPFNPANGLSFKPEYLNAYEVGFKSILFDHRLTANLAAFYYDFTNKQEQINTGVSFVVSNAATATSKGAEVELNWIPIDGLNLFANAGYLDAYYNKFPNGGGVGVNYNGHVLAGASKYSASWGGNYTAPIPAWSGKNVAISADWDYRTPQFTDPANTKALQVNEYLLFNAHAGVESADGRWGAYLWGKNLTNKTVLGGGTDVIGGLYINRTINVGRTFGIELRGRY